MKLYVGSRDYKPEGFLSVDIDPAWNPDIVGDITDLRNIENESVSEVVASHVLEHLAWPDSFLALGEFQRILQSGGVLEIAVPDAGLLAELIASGKSSWHAIGLLFGVGRRTNHFEAHQYSFTQQMLCDVLSVLGFSKFEHWNSDFPDASNGWQPIIDGATVAISLNIKSVKTGSPVVKPALLYEKLKLSMLSDIDFVIKNHVLAEDVNLNEHDSRCLIQSLHMKLIEERQARICLQTKVAALQHKLDHTIAKFISE